MNPELKLFFEFVVLELVKMRLEVLDLDLVLLELILVGFFFLLVKQESESV